MKKLALVLASVLLLAGCANAPVSSSTASIATTPSSSAPSSSSVVSESEVGSPKNTSSPGGAERKLGDKRIIHDFLFFLVDSNIASYMDFPISSFSDLTDTDEKYNTLGALTHWMYYLDNRLDRHNTTSLTYPVKYIDEISQQLFGTTIDFSDYQAEGSTENIKKVGEHPWNYGVVLPETIKYVDGILTVEAEHYYYSDYMAAYEGDKVEKELTPYITTQYTFLYLPENVYNPFQLKSVEAI